ncbi:hypothetical protein HWV62_26380 [Athelia sp. TMB]|nr:hypothetical protein HWV62_26380 [Athelia sp. TMB]
MGTIAPHETTTQPAQTSAPLVATGDWTKDLVHLAKTAELKKHALTLQLHTAHILSAHASLDVKSKAIQDIKEQKNKLESERTRLLNCLREADLHEASLTRECSDLRGKITVLTDGDYAIAKRDVDRLRQELGQPPLPSLQSTIDEKSAQYLNQRRLDGNTQDDGHGQTPQAKRSATEAPADGQPAPGKRPRGRPKGSKNKTKGQAEAN